MTDNEIIKALKCCTSKGKKCSDCPAFKKVDRSDCKKYFRGALDLINRQQAQLADERAKIEICAETISRQDAEIERLRNENEILSKNADNAFQDGLNEAQDLYAEQVKAEIKSEAIKEFAERLKANITINNTNDGYLDYAVDYNCLMEDIDDLEKEMAGEDK